MIIIGNKNRGARDVQVIDFMTFKQTLMNFATVKNKFHGLIK